MKRYVCVFAVPIAARQHDVILIERAKKDWQINRLNLPGGSIEDGETVEAAAVRELREETSLVGMPYDARVLGDLVCNGCHVYFVYVPYHKEHDGSPQFPASVSDEGLIETLDLRAAVCDERLIPNLKIIIPLCQARVSGWRLTTDGDPQGSVWNIDFNPVESHAVSV